jgi:hypothetical protein
VVPLEEAASATTAELATIYEAEPDCLDDATVGRGGAMLQLMVARKEPSWRIGGHCPPHNASLLRWTAQVDGTDTCALPYATGTHPTGVTDTSTAGVGWVVGGTVVVDGTPFWVVGGTVWALLHAASVTAKTTGTRTRSLTLAMLPMKPGRACSRTGRFTRLAMSVRQSCARVR